MDRGYVDYKRLYDIELAKSFLVARMKTNCQYEVERKLSDSTTGAIRYDGIIRLSSAKGQENYPVQFVRSDTTIMNMIATIYP